MDKNYKFHQRYFDSLSNNEKGIYICDLLENISAELKITPIEASKKILPEINLENWARVQNVVSILTSGEETPSRPEDSVERPFHGRMRL